MGLGQPRSEEVEATPSRTTVPLTASMAIDAIAEWKVELELAAAIAALNPSSAAGLQVRVRLDNSTDTLFARRDE